MSTNATNALTTNDKHIFELNSAICQRIFPFKKKKIPYKFFKTSKLSRKFSSGCLWSDQKKSPEDSLRPDHMRGPGFNTVTEVAGTIGEKHGEIGRAHV